MVQQAGTMLPAVPIGQHSRDLEKKISGIVAIQFSDGNDDDGFVMHSDPIGGAFYAILLCYKPQSTLYILYPEFLSES